MNIRFVVGQLTLGGTIVALSALPAATVDVPTKPQAQEQWERQAEESFRLGPGMGQRLMTQEEWQQYQEKIRTMTPQERASYREEWHKKLVERARERGISMPETPGPHSLGGRGSSPGGR